MEYLTKVHFENLGTSDKDIRVEDSLQIWCQSINWNSRYQDHHLEWNDFEKTVFKVFHTEHMYLRGPYIDTFPWNVLFLVPGTWTFLPLPSSLWNIDIKLMQDRYNTNLTLLDKFHTLDLTTRNSALLDGRN